MKYDLNKDISFLKGMKFDVCIVGAGAAGITLALSLAKKGHQVALLEAGSEKYTQKSQDIYQGESVGNEYWNQLQTCRLRYLGGTTNHWAGRCMVLQEFDFEKNEHIELSGWPIKKNELDIHLKETLEILDIDVSHEDVKNSEFSPNSSFIDAWTKLSSPTRFGSKYSSTLENTENIHLVLNSNINNIHLTNTLNSVTHLNVVNYNNTNVSIHAKKYILATGAVENARLLLNCNEQIPNGIGNHSDYVGRCFMEHLNVDMGRVVADLTHPLWSKLKTTNALEIFSSSKLVQEQKIGSGVVSVSISANKPLYGTLKGFKEFIRDVSCSSENATDLIRKFKHFNCPGDGLVTSLIEQEPNKASRIYLNEEKDFLGLRKCTLDWQISDFDKRTIRTLAFELAKEFSRLDMARIQLPDYLLNDDDFDIGGHCHQMGTTRMSANEKDGVVDKNCKIFNVDNLYIAGSSVFTTGGGVNPTFSIVQLALRLSEHLNLKLKSAV